MSSLDFWTVHQVGGPYHTVEESAQALRERLRMYPTLLDLMPVNYPGKKVLDFGCGPGHDAILMAQLGADVAAADWSQQARSTTQRRAELHGLQDSIEVTYPSMDYWSPQIDHIHCAGVLHHTEYPREILRWFKEALAPDGDISLMVYDGDRSTRTQSEVPITNWWGEQDVTEMAQQAGFHARYLGSYECSAEWRPDCLAACYRLHA